MQTKSSIERGQKVDALIAKGTRKADALTEVGLASSVYYQYCKEKKGSNGNRAPVKFVDLAGPTSAGQVTVIVCSVENLKQVLEIIK